MEETTEPRPPPRTRGGALRRFGPAVPVVSFAILAGLLAVRTLTSPDLGYHLAYGEHLLDTGRIVDANPFLYTLPGAGDPRPEPGPACWYDRDGRYRFPNANWLSQAAMAAAHRWGGVMGLTVLQAALAAGLFALTAATIRRLGVGWLPAGAGLGLLVLVGYSRLNLRPEGFGYVLLAGQLCLLLPAGRPGAILSWRAVAALALLQLLFVNAHSYFLIGPAVTLAILLPQAGRLAWRRLAGSAADPPPDHLRANAGRLLAAFAAQTAACLLNPWTWRLVLLPVRTVAFLHRHGIAGRDPGASTHPWATILELFSPFCRLWAGQWDTRAYYVVLALAALAVIAGAAARRWGWVLILVGAAAASMRMRRNMFLAGIVIVPVAAALLTAVAGRLRRRRPPRGLTWAAGGVLAALAWCGCAAAVTNRFAPDQERTWRFGAGLCRLEMPLDAAGWINAHRPAGRLFADFGMSSNLHYLTRPHRDVPILTNTWAYPPEVMAEMAAYCLGMRDFAPLVRRYGIEIVALRLDAPAALLAQRLDRDRRWAMAHLDGRFAVFLRRDGPNAALARRFEVTRDSLDVKAFRTRLRARHPSPARPLDLGGLSLLYLGWHDAAIEVLGEAVRTDPACQRAWVNLGASLAARAMQRRRRVDHRALDDFREARDCFRKALQLDPDDELSRSNLGAAEAGIAEILTPPRRPPVR